MFEGREDQMSYMDEQNNAPMVPLISPPLDKNKIFSILALFYGFGLKWQNLLV